MKKTYLYALFLLSGALFSCENDVGIVSPADVENDSIYRGDGSIVFSVKLDGYFEYTPYATRACVMENKDKSIEWVDKATDYMFKATPVPPSKMPHVDPDDDESRGLPLGSGHGWYLMQQYGDGGLHSTAYWYHDESKTLVYHDETFKPTNGNDMTAMWKAGTFHHWPIKGDVEVFSWTPNSNLTVQNIDNNLYFDYTAPNFACDQKDIMVGSKYVGENNLPKNGGSECANMNYNHILAGVKFRVACAPGAGKDDNNNNQGYLLNRFDVFFPKRGGRYDVKNRSWSYYNDQPGDVWAWSSEENNYDMNSPKHNFEKSSWEDHTFNDVMSDEQTFMVIPQNLSGGKIRIFYRKKDGSIVNYDFNFPDIQLYAGTLTTIDIQEPSIFVEQYKIGFEWGGGIADNAWNAPYHYNNDGSASLSYEYFRLIEDPNGNYYKTQHRLWFPGHVPADEDNAWNNNEAQYYGHAARFNILCRTHSAAAANIFYTPRDLRFDFFIAKEETYDYRERIYNRHREQVIKDLMDNRASYFNNTNDEGLRYDYAAAPSMWDDATYGTDKTLAVLRDQGCPWETLGGEMEIEVHPYKTWELNNNINSYNSQTGGRKAFEVVRTSKKIYPRFGEGGGYVKFKAVDGNNSQIRYPARLPICGSTWGFPCIYIQPLKEHWWKAGDRDDVSNDPYLSPNTIVGTRKDANNLRSMKVHALVHKGGGYYESNGYLSNKDGTWNDVVYINQWAPYEYWGSANGTIWFPFSWRGSGSFICFGSTMHGCFGHKDVYPWNELTSRMGISTTAGQHDITHMNKSNSLESSAPGAPTVYHYSRTFTDSYVAFPTGVYNLSYNMNTKELKLGSRRANLYNLKKPNATANGSYHHYATPYANSSYKGPVYPGRDAETMTSETKYKTYHWNKGRDSKNTYDLYTHSYGSHALNPDDL